GHALAWTPQDKHRRQEEPLDMNRLTKGLAAIFGAVIAAGTLSVPAWAHTHASTVSGNRNGGSIAHIAFASASGQLVVDWNRELLKIEQTPGTQPPTIHPTRSFAI